jgi:dTDP-4-amino-4,6-dideoxygalactose transaminase
MSETVGLQAEEGFDSGGLYAGGQARSWQSPRLRLGDLVRRRQPSPAEPFASCRPWYFAYGANALFAGVRALGLGPASRILVPAYHCGVEVGALVDAGCEVAFHRVTPTLEADLDDVERLLKEGAKALLVIHYFGFAQPVEELSRLARRFGVWLIEDCAHALLGEHDGRPLGTTGDAAIYSLRKFLPIPDGGALILKPGLGPPAPSRRRGGGPRELRRIGLFYLKGRGLWTRSVRPRERSAAPSPSAEPAPTWTPRTEYDMAISSSSRWVWERADWQRIRRLRRRNYALLRAAVAGIDGVRPLTPVAPEGTCPWVLPVMVAERDRVVRQLRARGVGAVRFWARSLRGFGGDRFPEVQQLRDHVLALPVHQDVTEDYVHRMSVAVREVVGGS